MLVQHAAAAHPLDGTIAEYLWLLPLLPLAGFVLNGALSLASAYRTGPADPSAHGDEGAGHDHDGAHAPSASGGAHGDDHHPVARHRYAGVASVLGPLVLALSFALAAAMFAAMLGAGEMHAPFVQRYF
ncbi:MAG: hypothetical protein ACREON_10135, partial [Gemmatimonadaceae bacterium]